eukprot:SAG11_NODE_18780_length_481_cov_1.201571_1_plen_25_part_10
MRRPRVGEALHGSMVGMVAMSDDLD